MNMFHLFQSFRTFKLFLAQRLLSKGLRQMPQGAKWRFEVGE